MPLEDQILEIDSLLNGVDISEISEREEVEKNIEVHVENSSSDASKELPVILEKGRKQVLVTWRRGWSRGDFNSKVC